MYEDLQGGDDPRPSVLGCAPVYLATLDPGSQEPVHGGGFQHVTVPVKVKNVWEDQGVGPRVDRGRATLRPEVGR